MCGESLNSDKKYRNHMNTVHNLSTTSSRSGNGGGSGGGSGSGGSGGGGGGGGGLDVPLGTRLSVYWDLVRSILDLFIVNM